MIEESDSLFHSKKFHNTTNHVNIFHQLLYSFIQSSFEIEAILWFEYRNMRRNFLLDEWRQITKHCVMIGHVNPYNEKATQE